MAGDPAKKMPPNLAEDSRPGGSHLTSHDEPSEPAPAREQEAPREKARPERATPLMRPDPRTIRGAALRAWQRDPKRGDPAFTHKQLIDQYLDQYLDRPMPAGNESELVLAYRISRSLTVTSMKGWSGRGLGPAEKNLRDLALDSETSKFRHATEGVRQSEDFEAIADILLRTPEFAALKPARRPAVPDECPNGLELTIDPGPRIDGEAWDAYGKTDRAEPDPGARCGSPVGSTRANGSPSAKMRKVVSPHRSFRASAFR